MRRASNDNNRGTQVLQQADLDRIWRQGCAIFPTGRRGRALLSGFGGPRGLQRFAQAIVFEVVAALVKAQDTLPQTPEIRRLGDLPDSPFVRKAKQEVLRLGLRFASAVRRMRREGIERRPALTFLAEDHGKTAFEVEVYAKHAITARDRRIDRLRGTLIPRWRAADMPVRDIADRLGVTAQHARRIINEIETADREAREDLLEAKTP